jgi:hypothetical protein
MSEKCHERTSDSRAGWSAIAWDLSRFPDDPSIPGAQLYMFDGKGHNPTFSATNDFCDELRNFIRTGRGGKNVSGISGGRLGARKSKANWCLP